MYSFKSWLLNEMLVHKETASPKYVIAFRGDMWLLPESLNMKQANEIIDKIGSQHPEVAEKLKLVHYFPNDIIDSYELASHLSENIADILVGSIHGRKVYLDFSEHIDLKTSPLVKKVYQVLKMPFVALSYDAEGREKEVNIRKKEIAGTLSKELYHGTRLRYLFDILRFGLKPGASPSNYEKENIIHPDKVFLTASLQKAENHAMHTSGFNAPKKPDDDAPVVLKFKIPDAGKMFPDYDSDAMSSGTTYNRKYTGMPKYSVSSEKTIKQSGNLGYRGRIPASFITEVRIFNGNDWFVIKGKGIDTLKNRLDKGEEWRYVKF